MSDKTELIIGRDWIEKTRTVIALTFLALFIGSLIQYDFLQNQQLTQLRQRAEVAATAHQFVVDLTTYSYQDLNQQTLALTNLVTPSLLVKVKSDQANLLLLQETSSTLTTVLRSSGVSGSSGDVVIEVTKSYFNRLHNQAPIKVGGTIFCQLANYQGGWRVKSFQWGELSELP